MRQNKLAACIALAAGAAFSSTAQAQSFTNPNFETGDLTGWTVTNTAVGTTHLSLVEATDIDGPGPLGTSLAAKFAVAQATTGTGQQGIELTQDIVLTAGQSYAISFNWAATRDSTTSNAEGGVFTLFVDSSDLATQAAGSTSSTNPHYGFIEGIFTATTTGSHRIGVRMTRPFTGSTVTPHQRLDNFAIGPAITGACCTFGGCTVTTNTACTASGGTYQGNGSICGSCPGLPPVIYTNCNLSTGATTLSGAAAPAGSTWSEVARYDTDLTSANTNAGSAGSGAFRLADDFVVPAGGMNIAYLRLPIYTTGATAVTTTAVNLQIWDGPPGQAGSNVVFGDTTTNRMANATFSNIYRTFNTVVAPVCGGATTAPGTTRRIQDVYVTVNHTLPAGTYWIDFNYTGGTFSPLATSATAIGSQCNPNNANAMQFNAGWVPVMDAGQGCTPVPSTQDLAFALLGTTGGGCYANCDNSTNPPILNVLDFNCFLNAFNAGASYANCDNSTNPPVLNVLDFNCFLNRFNQGCP